MYIRHADIPDGMMLLVSRAGGDPPVVLIYNIGEKRYALESEAKQALLRSLQERQGSQRDVQDVPRRGEAEREENGLEEGAR